nr:DJ-1 family glyoxalase III [uncultured Methylophaga sp.]
MSTVLIPLAEGFEEIEAVTVIDLLRRAGINVVTASLSQRHQVTGSRQIVLFADDLLEDMVNADFDMIVLPGGQPGTNNLNQDSRISVLLQKQLNANKHIAAICAAPLVLAHAKILNQHKATCYPGAIKQEEWPEISLSDESVIVDDRIITSKGPGTAMDFALTLIEVLTNHQTRHTVEQDLVRK